MYTIKDYPTFDKVLFASGIKVPPAICFIPENLEEAGAEAEFIYPESTTDLKKIFSANGLTTQYLVNHKPLLRARKSADWIGPTFFIGTALLSDNSGVVGVALNVLSNYLYDFFKGTLSFREPKIKFEIIIEDKDHVYQKINYEGNIEGIKELQTVIKQLKK